MEVNARRFFISYAHGGADDERLRSWLHDALTQAGHEVFFDGKIPFGTAWADEIERQLGLCDFLIVLLSESSVRSEAVLEEIRRARERLRATRAPRFLTIRVKFDGALPYAWATYLGKYQWKIWQGDADSQPILQAILDVAGGRVEAPAIDSSGARVPAEAGPPEDFRRPEPSVDLRSVVAPGGALPPTDPFYISRQADAEILEFAQRSGETVVIKAPRQMGKSSLLKRYLLESQKNGKSVALLDLSLFSDMDLADYPTFLTNLAADVLDKLGIDAPPPSLKSQPDFSRFIEKQVLKVVPKPVVLAFDEVDRILGQDYQSSFFSLLRYWHERRTDPTQTAWARLELALIISTEPYLLIDDALRSPFNVRAPIELQPFTREECRELNRRYGQLLTDDQFGRLYELLNGHPYLTRVAYYHLTRKSGLDFATLMRSAHEPNGPFRDHLRTLLSKVRQSPQRDLLAALQQVIQHGTAPAGAFERLHGAGLCRKVDGRIVPSNQLYARFFGSVA